MDFYSQLHALLCEDATGRGLAAAAPAPDFDAVTRTLRSARRAVILTGFPVDCGPEGVRGETDGPGGSAELADLDGNTVKIRLTGMCSGCAGAAGTLKNFIEKTLKEKVDSSLSVEQA